MAKHQQPHELAELKGADVKNPQRYRKSVPKSAVPLGDYPEVRSTDPKDCWFELAALAIPGVLTGSDRILMEVLAHLVAEFRTSPVDFSGAKLAQLIGICARFGMSASDRNKLGVDKPKDEENPFAALDD
jgi:hypothetical protein